MTMPIKLFVSYSHFDSKLVKQVLIQFALYEQQGRVTIWRDVKMEAGVPLTDTFTQRLKDADVILLMLSGYYLRSKNCYEIEGDIALNRHASGKARVIPIILSHCSWMESKFGNLLALPEEGKTIETSKNRSQTCFTVAQEVMRSAESFRDNNPYKYGDCHKYDSPLDWIERINRLMNGDVEIKRLVDREPTLTIHDHPALSLNDEQESLAFRRSLKINDNVAVLAAAPLWQDNPVELQLFKTDYATVCALDKAGKRPMILSASTLLVCRESQEVVLHRRDGHISRDYKHALHTFGGAYMPPEKDGRDYDHLSLIAAARREVMEESSIGIDVTNCPPMLLGSEPRIGFIHLALLGVNVSNAALARAQHNHEGRISRIPWKEIQDRLTTETWVPAGKSHVLAWLAMNAPVENGFANFGLKTGRDIFEAVVLGTS